MSDTSDDVVDVEDPRAMARLRSGLRASAAVQSAIRKFWALMVAESSRITPNENGVVTREGYSELHLRVSLALSSADWADMATSKNIAHTDWTSDIATFAGFDAASIWLQEIKKKFQVVVKSSLQDRGGLRGLFTLYDQDGNGELDFQEFLAAVRKDCNIAEEVASDEGLQNLFSMVDVDNGGTISADEFEELLQAETVQDMTFEIFFDSMFELAELWAAEFMEDALVRFINQLFARVTVKRNEDAGVKTPRFKLVRRCPM